MEKVNPRKKKNYQAPSITSLSSNFIPIGATACSYGDAGSSCTSGNSPQIQPTGCAIGNRPDVTDCITGTSANNACQTGTDAMTNCDTGTRFPGDCISGDSPLGPVCNTGTGVA